ncbi:MAG: COQ9 family protein [Phaeobacter italicus]|jgi:ubiquinone biosynthesis protein COQ9|uniref:RpsU-divergently transcribed protein n=1 Tax=Phaeobacter italicus TaxID=481446 RepID=A0A0H5D6U8_9RHOB|nr:COQ9 family protein [Phaeobacter italicus]EEB69423.1 rpsU-divergently transcribed protein [Ruegeria sp. R11]MEC8015390.1 COQ9 family protein [Pseudomonadota bacterium]NKX41505.1 COQ9 family protein [Rhodobacteraceae bacterium R_SAG2]MBO9442627.1 COQ9 family protein [Phaeobacter italicus]MEC8572305.1 COQ9 family protein [Pseudomonadota bacterium]
MTLKHDTAPAADDVVNQLLDAALMHVPFDGWSDATFAAAVSDAGVDRIVADAICPRGAVDLAVAYHKRGDALMLEQLAAEDMTGLRFRDKIARAVQLRLEVIDDKEAVRRGTTLFSLPQYAGDGVKLVWGTVDAIWTALGDSSEDINWYTKRGTLSGVYSATVLYWLGDDSLDHQATWEFLDRRIDNVMQFEKLKAKVQSNPLLKPLMVGPNWLAQQIRAPEARDDLPGSVGPRT